MTNKRKTELLALLALLAFSLPIFHALLTAVQICTDDLTVHIHEAYALQRLIESGHLLSRWSPDLAQGYGYPLFNFYAPLSSYPLAFLGLLGFSYPFAAQLTLVLFVWLAGLGMYLCARNLFGPVAALAAAVAYVYAPYLGYDIFFRGAATEVLAWVWIPFCLWALRVAAQRASWRWAAFAGLCYAALLPSHNLAALLSTPLLGAWAIFTVLETKQLARLRYGLIGLALGLGLAAAFWVPALAERDLVQSNRLLEPPLLQYGTNFIQVDELLAPPQIVDPNLANPSPPRALGGLTALFAVLSVLAIVRRPSPRLLILLLTLGLVGYASFTLKFSEPLWGLIPLLKFAQFPWRMLTPAAACAALLVGASVSAWGKATVLLTGLASVALAVGATGWFTPTYCPPEADLKAGTFVEGSFGYSEYLPDPVVVFPKDDSLYNALARGETPERLQSPGTVKVLQSDPLNAAYDLTLDHPAELTYRQFYYPGWQVWVDGASVAVNVQDDGLIRFEVPAGSHALQINFGETPLRFGADVVSILAALLLAGLWWKGRATVGVLHPSQTSVSGWLVLIGIGLVLSLITLIFKPLQQTRFDGESVRGTSPVRASFAGGVEVYGATIPTVESGGAFDVTVYAGVRDTIAQRYVPAITVEDEAGLRWNESSMDFARGLRPPFTANDWKPGQYALWARQVQLLTGTPPGIYNVWLTVYDADTNAVDSVLGADGNLVDPRLKLGTVTVTRPSATNAVITGQPPLFGMGSVDRNDARAGDTVLVSILWNVNQKPALDTSAFIELINDASVVAASEPITPDTPNWPLGNWAAGDEWRGQYLFRIPADLPNGFYGWRLRLSNSAGQIPLGSGISITAPQRVFTAPSVTQPVGAQIGDFTTLLGYDVSQNAKAGEQIKVSLFWKALATADASYSVFVHLSDADGHLWAQNDSGPQAGLRPTTGWLSDEYIIDEHRLDLPTDLPAGTYTLYVGMADPTSGQRVPVGGAGAGDDGRIQIGALEVTP
jgi:6-pyruvoyl-tetrahydropterin synthase related domain